MDPHALIRNLPGFSRRDFLKVLSAGGGVLASGWLLGGCVPGTEMLPATAVPTLEATQNPAPPAPFTETTAASETAAPSETAEPTSTSTNTPAPTAASETLPPVTTGMQTYDLPVPRTDRGLPLMQALLKRHSTRAFTRAELSVQVLSDLLWAAFGINRPQTGGRTAPSALNVRDIDIYLATVKGLYRYEASTHALTALLPDDLRPLTGSQAFVAEAPVNLVYVSDYSRMAASAEDREHWSWAHTGFISQNVYLFCASEGLVTVVRSSINRNPLAESMGLNQNQHITLAQSLGYPAAG